VCFVSRKIMIIVRVLEKKINKILRGKNIEKNRVNTRMMMTYNDGGDDDNSGLEEALI